MRVPKASVDHHDRTISRKDNIWLSWKILSMQSEASSRPMQCASDQNLWLGILASEASHQALPVLWVHGRHGLNMGYSYRYDHPRAL